MFVDSCKDPAKDTERQPIANVTEIFHGKIVDVTNDSMVIQLVGHQDKLDAFLDLLDGYEILELARTGITGLTRGSSDVRFLISYVLLIKNIFLYKSIHI